MLRCSATSAIMALDESASAIMPDSQIENILSRATQDVRKLIEEAYEAGRGSARDEIRAGLYAYLSSGGEPTFLGSIDTPVIAATEQTTERAPSGTVKPGIKALIENARNGITASQIIEKTGFKENSVRGTLSALKAEGVAERRGELWFLSQEKDSPALASESS